MRLYRHRRLLINATPSFLVEQLEDRRLLSATFGTTTALLEASIPTGWKVTPAIDPLYSGHPAAGDTAPTGLSPNQIRGAYGLGGYTSGVPANGISFGGIQGDGCGQTIAIVDVYDDPYAASDLNAFSTHYGLPTLGGAGQPTFQKLNQSGGTTLPGTDPAGPTSSGADWEQEESLDIEWAHVMAPLANIILFEASDPNTGPFTAVQTAANTPGVVAVSMSWSGAEFSGETSTDALFTTPLGHVGGSSSVGGTGLTGGVTFLAATGDYGAYAPGTMTITPQYPAASSNVVAVGGTQLTVGGSDPNYTYGSETGWGCGTLSGLLGGGGGGISAYESQPAWQNSTVSAFSTTNRTYPDVATDASSNSGVSLYDSWDNGNTTPWMEVGGTSLACPLWAGVIAVADEGRAIAGMGSLDGPSQTLPALYKLPAGDFHDITSGSNGPAPTYVAKAGYDLITGIGSPVGNLLAPALASLTQTATSTAVTTNSPAAIYGQQVTFTATVTPSSGSGETGRVQFLIDGSPAGSPVTLSGNTANYTTTTLLLAGTHTITAIYSGDYYFAGSTSAAFTQTIAPATIAVMPPGNQVAVINLSKSFSLGNLAVNANAVAPFSVDVNWGDSSADTIINNLTAAGTIPAQSHTYTAIGSDTVTLTAMDSASHFSDSVTFTISTFLTNPFVVNTLVDQMDPSGCTTISLRDAIALAAANSGPDTILVPAGNYTLSLGELKISDASGNLTIASTGGVASIQGNGSTRVLEIDAPSNVAITGLEITGGSLYGNSATLQEGAGIYNTAILTLTDVTVDGNSIVQTAGPAAGAGIENTGTLTVIDSTITDNTASGAVSNAGWSGNVSGGGIDSSGNATITNSTISGNSLTASSLAFYYTGYPAGEVNGHGAGISNRGTMTLRAVSVTGNSIQTSYGGNAAGAGIANEGNLTVVSSTISTNQAATQAGGSLSYSGECTGGGINNTGNTTIVDSTISGDSATASGTAGAYGGGILNNGNLTLCDSTVSGDLVSTTTTKYSGLFGGLLGGPSYYTGAAYGGGAKAGAGVTTVANSIISGNIDIAISNYAGENGSAAAPDATGAFTSLGHNLIGQSNGSVGWVTADLTGNTASPLNADLGALANNGGPTQTMLPLTGSPAIAAGSIVLIPSGVTTDQRGLARIYNGTVDIGAVEIQPLATTTTTAITSSNGSSAYGQMVTFTATVTPTSGSGETGTVQFQIDGGNVGTPVTLSGNTASYTTCTLTAGSHAVAAIYSGDGNFAGSTAATFRQTVARATPTLTWTSPTAITYGTALSGTQLAASASVAGGFVYSPLAGTVLHAGTQNLSVTFTPTDTLDYTTTSASVNLTVNQAVLTVTANNQTRAVGYANPTFTYTFAGFVNGDTASVVSGVPSLSTAATLSSPAGIYPITLVANTLAANDYSFNLVAGNLTVTAQVATTVAVTANLGSPTYGQSVLFTATITPAAGSGETGTVRFQIDGGNVGSPVTVSGNSASYRTASLAIGNHTVVAVYSGDGNFSGATSATFSITVAAPTTITATPPANQSASAEQSDTFLLGSFTQTNATGPFNVTVNWGDGSTQTVIPVTTAGAIPNASHTFANLGTDTVTITVTDSASHTSNPVLFTITVLPGWLSPSDATSTWNVTTQTLTLTGNAAITDDPSNWGDAPNIVASGNASLIINTGGIGMTVNLSSLTVTGNATLDVQNNIVLVTNTTADPASTIQSYIFGGQIMSSKVNAGSNYGIGYGATTVNGGSYTEFRYDIKGDANLDGTVNNTDLTTMLQNLGLPTTQWSLGNFEYHAASPGSNATVNNSDLTDVLQNLGLSMPAAAGISASTVRTVQLNATVAATPVPTPVPQSTVTTPLVATATPVSNPVSALMAALAAAPATAATARYVSAPTAAATPAPALPAIADSAIGADGLYLGVSYQPVFAA